MDAKELLISQLVAGRQTLLGAVGSLDQHEFLETLPRAGENADWIFGHLASNEDWFLTKLTGTSLALADEFRDAYQADYPPPTHTPLGKSRDEMLDLFQAQRERVIAAVLSADPSKWGSAAPTDFPDIFPTLGSVWALLGTHQYWHLGQLMSIRAMLGREPFQFSPHVNPAAKAIGRNRSGGPRTMTDLIMPKDGPRVLPKLPHQVSPYVRAEYDKAVETWGIPNNLSRTMGCHPQLSLTEVDYANSFIFQNNMFAEIPRPGAPEGAPSVLFPSAGFIDRVTKELVISVVSLLNRSRFSITHHSVIAFGTLSAMVRGATPEARAARAEQMLLHLVDDTGRTVFESQDYQGEPLYSEFQVSAMRLAEKMNREAHSVTDEEIKTLRRLLANEAKAAIRGGPLATQFGKEGPDNAYVEAYVDGMLVELTWCIGHFSGLLNRWFTVLRVRDEEFAVNADGSSFVDAYNRAVPESIKIRNNALLGADGWGSR